MRKLRSFHIEMSERHVHLTSHSLGHALEYRGTGEDTGGKTNYNSDAYGGLATSGGCQTIVCRRRY